jgi:hypothetical protein
MGYIFQTDSRFSTGLTCETTIHYLRLVIEQFSYRCRFYSVTIRDLFEGMSTFMLGKILALAGLDMKVVEGVGMVLIFLLDVVSDLNLRWPMVAVPDRANY